MYKNTQEIKTLGYVLKRTNFGEADRILNIITPEGKIAAIAKGVRKPKSKLAGGVEILTLSEYVIHRGKGEIGTATGAKMKEHFGGILKDYEKMELAAEILKEVSRASESSDSAEYFKLVDSSLRALNSGASAGLVRAWFFLNLLRASGEEPNFYRDAGGEKLSAEARYNWDTMERAFFETDFGEYGAEEIKLLRLMLVSDLAVVMRVKNAPEKMPKILRLIKVMIK